MTVSALLRIPAFRNLWLGQAMSQMGDAFYYVTFMFMVDKVTHDPAMVGYVGALETLPFLLLGPFAGVLADRIDRRAIMLGSDVFSGLVLALFATTLALGKTPPVWTLLVVPCLLSCVRCFFIPAKTASIPKLVPVEGLSAANSLSMSTQNVMQLAGLCASAGVVSLLWSWSPKWFFLSCVLANAVSFYASAFFVSRLPEIVPDRDKASHPHVLTDLREGLSYVKRRHDLTVLTAMLAVFRLMVAPFFVVYVVANNEWFGGKPATLAWFEAAFFMGMIVAASFTGRVRVLRPMRWFCGGLAACGLSVAAMAVSPYFSLFVLWNLVAGLVIPFGDVPINTYLQVSVPDAFRGRVNALREMIATGVMPIGMVLGGTLVKNWGLFTGFMVMGLGMTIAALGGLADRRFRDTEMPSVTGDSTQPKEPEPAEGVPCLR